MCVSLADKQLISTEYVWRFARRQSAAAGMGDRESINPKEGSRKLGLVRGHDVEVGEEEEEEERERKKKDI